MKYVDQKGRCYEEETFQDKFLKLLYGTYIGRIKLKILTKPWISRLGGLFLSTGFSKCLIERFVRKNKIDMREYEDRSIRLIMIFSRGGSSLESGCFLKIRTFCSVLATVKQAHTA